MNIIICNIIIVNFYSPRYHRVVTDDVGDRKLRRRPGGQPRRPGRVQVDTVRRRQTARACTTFAAVRTSSLVPGHSGRRAHTGVVLARGPVRRPAGHRAGRAGQLHRDGRHRRRSSAAIGGGQRSARPGHRRVRGPDPAARQDVRRTAHVRVQAARRLLLSVLVVRRRPFRPQSSFCFRRRSVIVTLLFRIVFDARTRLQCAVRDARRSTRSSASINHDERLNLPT